MGGEWPRLWRRYEAGYDQNPSASTINITRTNDEVELPQVTGNNKSIMEKKQVTFEHEIERNRNQTDTEVLILFYWWQ